MVHFTAVSEKSEVMQEEEEEEEAPEFCMSYTEGVYLYLIKENRRVINTI